MGLNIAREITVDAPRERVWSYLTDFGRHTEWADPKNVLRIQPPREVRAGATFSSIGKDMGRDSKNAVTITEVVPGERIAYVATQDNGSVWRNAFELADADGGTRVRKRTTFTKGPFPFSVLVALLGPLLASEGAKITSGDLARIKARLEQRGAEVAS